ncbi:hypothetical protein C4565_02960 [Candidatus Parcubacteria bacterium]|nr:MAG: hypothetical protein C4565_02960 [Candidatus Parcubacteria bacterium]
MSSFSKHRIKDIIFNKTVLGFTILILVATAVRLYYFPYNIPLIADALSYFSYATDIIYHGGSLPTWSPVNNGWPLFLSAIFSATSLENSLAYMEFQRGVSVFFSILTAIPLYFLCRKFFAPPFALIGVSIFLFDPRLILNSFLGITEPLFIFLACAGLLLFLQNNKKMIYLSFGIVSLATIIRSEGLFLFFALSIMFFIRFRRETRVWLRYLPAVAIFVIILMPIMAYRIEVSNSDGIFLRAGYAISHTSSLANTDDGFFKLLNSPLLFIKYFGWVLLPVFVFFVPYGVFEIIRKRDVNVLTMICYFITMSIPILYAYSVPALDTRYLYTLYPILCIVSLFAVNKYHQKLKSRNIFLVLVTIGIISASLTFYELKKFDVEQEREEYEIAKQIVSLANGVNSHPKESSYIRAVQTPDAWPFPFSDTPSKTTTNSTINYDSLPEFIKDSKDTLTHLVVSEDERLPDFLRDVVLYPSKYPYLIEEYDSSKYGYDYHVLLYKIDYEKFWLIESENELP